MPGDGARTSARQAAYLFGLSGLLAIVAIPSDPSRAAVLCVIAAGDLAITAATLLLPWGRWGVRSTAVIAVPGCLVLGVSTWAFGGFGAGTGPFFVLLFAWLGLHHTPGIVLAVSPLATIAYAGGLLAAHSSPRLVGTTVVLIPVVVAVGLVISSRVRALDEARTTLQAEERWRSALITTLAHDVRTPLTAIQCTLELIEMEEEVPDDLRPLLASGLRQSARLASLTDGLLDLERIRAGKLRLDHEDIALSDFGAHVTQLLGRDDVRVDIDPGIVVSADRARLEQMVVNLATNAMRHGRPPVVITARADAGTVAISVRDHGPGVPDADVSTLFERLGSHSSRTGSVGLGLWIVRLLADAHGGDVSYRPAAPGAEFTITLPSRA